MLVDCGSFVVLSQSAINHVEVVLPVRLCPNPLPAAMLQAVRALMIVGIVLGVIGLLVAIFALKCIRIGNMDNPSKAKMTLTSGIMFIISGTPGAWAFLSQMGVKAKSSWQREHSFSLLGVV